MKGDIKQNDVLRKGQAATEFLMTYGWAILAIVIVAAVLWNMGVFKGQCAKTAAIQVFGSGEQIQASDWSINGSNYLTMKVKNLAGNDITVTSVDLGIVGGNTGSNITAIDNLPAGGEVTLNANAGGVGTSGNCFSADVNVSYSVEGGVGNHIVKGTVRGKY